MSREAGSEEAENRARYPLLYTEFDIRKRMATLRWPRSRVSFDIVIKAAEEAGLEGLAAEARRWELGPPEGEP